MSVECRETHEDPLPPADAGETFHLDQTVGENRRKATDARRDEVEPSEPTVR